MRMRGIIVESGIVAATNGDLLTATRLQTAPSDGTLLFQMQASDDDATNNYAVTLQMPDSDVPMDGQRVPGGETAGLARLSQEYMLQYVAEIGKGGRVVFALTETGDAEALWRVTFTPNR